MSIAVPDIPVIETERLRLRCFQPRDFAAVAAYKADPQVMRFTGGPEDELSAWKSFAAMIGHWFTLGHGYFCVALRDSDVCIGHIGLLHPPGWPGKEVSYTLARAHQGKGYATEAALAGLAFACGPLGWSEPISLIAPGNTSSQRVAERLGATRDPERLHVWGHDVELWRHKAPDQQLTAMAADTENRP